jgi:hypothetical protein
MPFSHPGQAIITTFTGATSGKPARIIATTQNQEPFAVTLHDTAGMGAASVEAVQGLADRLGWGGTWHSGDIKGGRAWVCVGARRKARAVV